MLIIKGGLKMALTKIELEKAIEVAKGEGKDTADLEKQLAELKKKRRVFLDECSS